MEEKGDNKEMSFIDHLEELRWHLIRSIIALIIIGIIIFASKDIITTILFAPRFADFPTHEFLCRYFTIHCDVPQFNIIQRDLGEEFFVHLKSSMWLSFIVAFPYLLWEMWRFIKPGLYVKEVKAARGMVAICSGLFFIGVMFGYFIIAPMTISFLSGYTFGTSNESTATLSSYVNYISSITLPVGLIFQLPVIVYFLGKLGVISARILKKFRRHAIVVVFILAAVVTPPDLPSQLLMAMPMILLYEISVSIVARIEKKKSRNTNEIN